MKRFVCVVATLGAAGLAGAAEDQVVLKEGPGRDVVAANCSMCHSLDYIPLNSPFLDRKGWEGSVTKMIKVMGAPIRSEDVPVIVDYLTGHYGK
jgi:mono/diheme cytochrome c family protein